MKKAAQGGKVRMSDIASALGVSAMTVSRAFRGDAGINAQTRARILSKAEEMGYVFDSTASSLRQNRTGFVAVTVPSIENANFSATVRELSKGLLKRNIQILLGNTEYDPEEEERLIAQLLCRNPEAIVLTGSEHTARTRALLSKAKMSVIEIWDLPAKPSATSSASRTRPPSGGSSITWSGRGFAGWPSSAVRPRMTPAARSGVPDSSTRCPGTGWRRRGWSLPARPRSA